MNCAPLGRMKLQLITAALVFLAASQARSADDTFVLSAAKAADRTVRWQRNSILSGNFICQGKRELAVLGTKDKEIVIAVFRRPSKKPVDILRYSGVARNPDSAILEIEPLDFDIKELKEQVGYVPDGLQSSKTCVGLNMTDQMVDSAHIYWNRKNRRFESWSL
jgi:hypothetical protein